MSFVPAASGPRGDARAARPVAVLRRAVLGGRARRAVLGGRARRVVPLAVALVGLLCLVLLVVAGRWGSGALRPAAGAPGACATAPAPDRSLRQPGAPSVTGPPERWMFVRQGPTGGLVLAGPGQPRPRCTFPG